jgi:hypothetical protein
MSGPPSVGASPRRWAWLVVTGIALAAVIGAAIAFFALRRHHRPELAGVMPHDLDVYLEVPSVSAFLKGAAAMRSFDADKLDHAAMIEEGILELATRLELPPADVRAALESVDAVAAGVRVGRDHHQHLLAARIQDAAAAEKLLASPRFVERGELERGRRFGIEGAPGPDPAGVVTPMSLWTGVVFDEPRYEVAAWFAKPRLFVLGSADLIDDLDEVLSGDGPSLVENEAFTATLESLPRSFVAFGFFDVRAVRMHPGGKDAADRLFANPEPFVASLSFLESGSRVTIHTPLSGKLMPNPRLDGEPASLTLFERLPVETLGYAAFSTRVGMSGKELEEALLSPYEKDDPHLAKDVKRSLDRLERDLGFKVRDAVDALGDEGAVAVMTSPSWRATASPSFPGDMAIAYLQKLRNEDEARRIVRKFRRQTIDVGDSRYELSEDKDERGFSGDPADSTSDPYVKVRFEGGTLFASFGARGLVDRYYRAFHKGENTLSQDTAHAEAVAALGSGMRAYGWVDSARIFEEILKADPTLSKELRDYGLAPEAFVTTGPQRFTSAMGLGWRADGEIWRPRLELHNVLPPVPLIAYYDLRHERTTLRSQEAQNAVRAIANAAKTAYESRERLRLIPAENDEDEAQYVTERTLCGSAEPVPAAIPKRRAYTPTEAHGTDYQTGDDARGWLCLGYGSTAGQHYRLTYRTGGGYLGPARGGPDPGPGGFEVSAEGDLDGDGITSLFTLTGTVTPGGTIDLAPSLFIADETE